MSFHATVIDSRRTAATKHIASVLPYISRNKTTSLFRQKQRIVFYYRYFIMPKYFGLSLDHLQANVHEYGIQSVSAY